MRALLFATCFVLRVAWPADGDVDPAFGVDGHVVLAPADASLSAFAVGITDDDRILVGGTRWAFTTAGMPNQAVVWRLLADGSLDASWGDGGIAVIPTPADASTLPAVWSLLSLHDGSVLAAGSLGGFGVARLLADGHVDPAFGIDGVATIAFDDLGVEATAAFAIARDGGDRILLAGGGRMGDAAGWNVGVAARLSADGVPDTQFASAGRFVLAAGDATTQQATLLLGIASDASNRVWLSGRRQQVPYSANYSALAARLAADGALDGDFGTAGIVTANRQSGSDDNIAAGVLRNGSWTIGGICDPSGVEPALCMLRIDADGHVDTAFGISGWTAASLGGSFALRNSAITCSSDNHCVLLGTSRDPTTSLRQYVVLRVDADGTPDTTFGVAGLARIAVHTGVDGSHVIARAIALQDGRPVAVGTTDGAPYVSALHATRLASNAIFGDGFERPSHD